MLSRGLRRIATSCNSRGLATAIRPHNNKNSNAPLLEKYRPVWPDADFGKGQPAELPSRTVPDDILRFELTATFESGSSLLYPHLPHNPADFKVKLKVSIDDLNLNKEEQAVLIRMVGSRYNPAKREVKLTAERFPSRIENKRYLVVVLEKLLAETKSLAAKKNEF